MNYTLDLFGIFKGDMKSQINEPNQHFLKVEFIINHQTDFDSFLFGSSRVGKIDTRKISDGNKWYNMAYSEGVPAEHLNDLKLFLKKGVEIKNITIGLDDISYLISPKIHEDQPMRKPYADDFNTYFDYLMLRPSYRVISSKIKGRDLNGFYSEYDIENSGVIEIKNVDEYINSYPKKHMQDRKFNQATWEPYYSNRTEESLKEISEIVNICNKNNIKVKFFINPIYITTYLRQNMNEFFDFLRGLSRITDFYDFSGINEITSNNINYYETSHYRPIIGDKISRIIFDKGVPEFQSFGKKINKKNIDSIINIKKHEIKDYNSMNNN